MRSKKIVINLCLTLTATLFCLIVLEIALRGYQAIKRFFHTSQDVDVPLQIVIDSPILYGLNPEHPEISSQGLRDEEVTIPKPRGTFRILVLGDSVAYGVLVSRNKAFPSILEELLRKQLSSVEVINASVSGYTAYNELQYYLTKGRRFEPDVVIVAFCMNDIANPRLHWRHNDEKIVEIPDEAIPNHDYDINYVLPKIQKLKKERFAKQKKERSSLLYYSVLYNTLKWRVKRLFQKKTNSIPDVKSELPTYITGEDTLSIEVLLDESSAEWQWLTSIYDQLQNAVKADQAILIIAVFPLAYQLDKEYPFFPQENIARYCKQNSILCIDLLKSFKNCEKEDIFILNKTELYDIWHLTEYGHAHSAAVIAHFLQEHRVLPERGRKK